MLAASGVARQKQQVARAGFEAAYRLRRSRMLHQHKLNADTRCERSSTLDPISL